MHALPEPKPSDTNAVSTAADQGEQYSPRVLFVEDDPISQFIHKRMLRRLNCEVDMADNATKALVMIESGYDVVLLDLGLPDKNGVELIKEIQAQKKNNKATRIIVLTVNRDEKTKAECVALGVKAILYKPIDLDRLNQVIYESGR